MQNAEKKVFQKGQKVAKQIDEEKCTEHAKDAPRMREKRAKETDEEKRIKHAIKHSSNQRDQGKTNS